MSGYTPKDTYMTDHVRAHTVVHARGMQDQGNTGRSTDPMSTPQGDPVNLGPMFTVDNRTNAVIPSKAPVQAPRSDILAPIRQMFGLP